MYKKEITDTKGFPMGPKSKFEGVPNFYEAQMVVSFYRLFRNSRAMNNAV